MADYSGRVVEQDAREAILKLPAQSVDLSFWSPPYFVGKSYERHLSFDAWQLLVAEVIQGHTRVIRPGGFMVVNIADILCFPSPAQMVSDMIPTTTTRSPEMRIDVFWRRVAGPRMTNSEFRTYSYIQEVLRKLGWDTRNPRSAGGAGLHAGRIQKARPLARRSPGQAGSREHHRDSLGGGTSILGSGSEERPFGPD